MILLLRLLLTAACLGAIAYRFRDPHIWSSLRIVHGELLLAGACLTFPLLGLRAWKWRILLRTSAPQATWAQALRSYLGALPLSLITPGKAGELIRGLYLPYPGLRWRVAGLTLVDDWTDFAAVAFWTLPALFAIGGFRTVALGTIVFLMIGIIPHWIRVLRKISKLVPRRFGLAEKWTSFWPASEELGWLPPLAAIAIGILAYGIEWMQIACFLKAFGGAGAFLGLAGNLAMAQLANSVQITVAWLGIREGSTAWILSRAGWDANLALAATLAQTSASLLLPALIGLGIKPLARFAR